jgi:hypothetical protein
MYEKIVEGNICNVWHNEVEVEELENDEEKWLKQRFCFKWR